MKVITNVLFILNHTGYSIAVGDLDGNGTIDYVTGSPKRYNMFGSVSTYILRITVKWLRNVDISSCGNIFKKYCFYCFREISSAMPETLRRATRTIIRSACMLVLLYDCTLSSFDIVRYPKRMDTPSIPSPFSVPFAYYPPPTPQSSRFLRLDIYVCSLRYIGAVYY